MDTASPKPDLSALHPSLHDARAGQPSKHAQFWFNDGNVTVEVRALHVDSTGIAQRYNQVSGVLFKLHKSLLASTSLMFDDMFALGDGAATGEGSDEKPLALPETAVDQFEVLCRAIYAGWGDELKFSTAELVQLLAITHKFQARAVHARAIAELDKRSVGLVDRLFYAQRYGIDDWLRSASTALAQSLYTLSGDEAGRIGWRLAFCIASAQKAIVTHRLARLALNNVCGCCHNCEANYVRSAQNYIASIVIGEPPAKVTRDGEGYWDHLRAELKTRCPSVGACGNQQCTAWPTTANVKSWVSADNEKEIVSNVLDQW